MGNRSEKGQLIAEQTITLLAQLDGLDSTGGKARYLKSRIIRLNMPLAANAARRYQDAVPSHIAGVDYLTNVAAMGISKAIDTYNPDKGTQFSTHCSVCMRRALSHYRRDNIGIPRRWVEVRDAVKSRQRLWKKVTGEHVSERRILEKSMDLPGDLWRDINLAFFHAFRPASLNTAHTALVEAVAHESIWIEN